MSFVPWADVCQNKMQKIPGCFTSVWLSCALSFLSSFRNFLLISLRKNTTSPLEHFHKVLIRDYEYDSKTNTCSGLSPSVDAGFDPWII